MVGTAMGGSVPIVEGPLKPVLLGEDPLRIEYLWQKMYMGGWRKPGGEG